MSRTTGKTALILGSDDVRDLQMCVSDAVSRFPQPRRTVVREARYRRLLRLQSRLNNAARRLNGDRRGRS